MLPAGAPPLGVGSGKAPQKKWVAKLRPEREKPELGDSREEVKYVQGSETSRHPQRPKEEGKACTCGGQRQFRELSHRISFYLLGTSSYNLYNTSVPHFSSFVK